MRGLFGNRRDFLRRSVKPPQHMGRRQRLPPYLAWNINLSRQFPENLSIFCAVYIEHFVGKQTLGDSLIVIQLVDVDRVQPQRKQRIQRYNENIKIL